VNADSYFTIGKTHSVCQDYAVAGLTDHPSLPGFTHPTDPDPEACRIPYAIVADGCSSSSHTDFGSRLLARATVKALQHRTVFSIAGDETPLWTNRLVEEAKAWSDGMNLPETSLDSTLLVAYRRRNGLVRVVATGDGVIIARRRESGAIEHWDIEFNRGAPGYLNYIPIQGRLEEYLSMGLGERTITYSICGGVFDVETSSITHEGGFDYLLDLDPDTYDLVMVASDGIKSFQRRQGNGFESVPLGVVIPHLTSLKNTRGQFMVRRMKRFLTKWCPKQGWHHYDDVAVAALHIPGEDDD